MNDWLRRAGRGRDGGGAVVTWSVAEGGRGRRWREIVAADGAVRSSLLLELDSEGRFSHLELSTEAGLLTLHPEGDGTLHGNAVTSEGVRHVMGWPWDRDRAIWVRGSSICLAAGRRPDGTRAVEWLDIDRDLRVETVVRTMRPDWSLVDAEGLPVLEDGTTWPLEA
ncbi:MAG TPA: hypothetical protein VFO73_01535 [Candidatus Limnocylindrales bacterium]|nr:hypothetical protein [Candidatus Limnocylindrales bacterium]